MYTNMIDNFFFYLEIYCKHTYANWYMLGNMGMKKVDENYLGLVQFLYCMIIYRKIILGRF